MKIFRSFAFESALPTAVLLLTPFAYAQERSIAPAIVTRNCSGCHERDGRSELPYIPRLAGQRATYSERKLANFRATASSPVDEAVSRIVRGGGKDPGLTRAAAANMVGVAHAISVRDIKDAARWYAAQTPGQGRSGNRKLIEEGRGLFVNGLKSKGLPACQSCHGPEAQGTNIAPRLAGQNAGYVVSQLAIFRGGNSHDSPEMTAVAKNIEGDQARAVAVYLQSR